MTDEPVVIHVVHAATGPGFNVYACPPCATHYPPPADPFGLFPPRTTPQTDTTHEAPARPTHHPHER
ncbi:hypothetical protein [Streptomyces sp. WMMC905]|uniref:hypothetical protein n=1 Tax=Streptomyces sp. WMMC905 TaxID=3404123 RepID=UPI0031FDF8F4